MATNDSPVREKELGDNEKGDVTYASEVPLEALPKSRWQRLWPTIACGAGLFSDGRIRFLGITYLSNILQATFKGT